MRKMIALLLCVLMIMGATLPIYAATARANHASDYVTEFYIDSSGLATVYVRYVGNTTTFTDFTVKTYIQKQSLGLIWTKVDNGEPNKTWVDSSTALTDSFEHELQLDSTGTYRAVFKITISGTGAEDDSFTERIEDVYS